jgi:hypothetical protein
MSDRIYPNHQITNNNQLTILLPYEGASIAPLPTNKQPTNNQQQITNNQQPTTNNQPKTNQQKNAI